MKREYSTPESDLLYFVMGDIIGTYDDTTDFEVSEDTGEGTPE